MEKYIFEKEQYKGRIHKDFVDVFKSLPIIYRLTGETNRIYFTHENGVVNLYNSGTTLINNYKDESGIIALEEWRNKLVSKGQNPSDYLKERQDYGTVLHLVYGDMLMGEDMDFEDLPGYMRNHLMGELGYTDFEAFRFAERNEEEFFKDVAAFSKWLVDFEVEPIAVELMLKSDKYKVATAIDAPCYITVNESGFWGEVYKSGPRKGEPKESKKKVRKLVIVDFKSGKSKGFYPVNILQLLLNRVIWEENFPDINLDGVYNFAPNNWRTSPTYEFYDQERETKTTNLLDEIKINVFERGLKLFEDKMATRKELAITGNVLNPTIEHLSLEEIARGYFDTENTEEVEE